MSFRDRVKNQERLIGTLLALGSPAAAEVLSHMGYDWLFIDLEHSAMGPAEAQQLLHAVGGRAATLIRVESRDEVGIRKALDLGADGIIIPQVNSKDEAEHFLALAKYPPFGTRSVGLGRAANYGNNFAGYVAQANQDTLVVLQVEHVDAVQNIEEIAAVAGIDAFFVGPYDLSGSMGKPGAVDDPLVSSALNKILSAARKHRIACGIFAGSAAVAQRYLDLGFTFVAVSTDGILLGRAARAELDAIK